MFFRCEPLMATRNPVITYQLIWKISRYFTTGLSTIPGGWPGEFLNHQQYVSFLGVHPVVRSPIWRPFLDKNLIRKFVEGDGAVVLSRENPTRACFGKKGVDLKHKNCKISVNLASIWLSLGLLPHEIHIFQITQTIVVQECFCEKGSNPYPE